MSMLNAYCIEAPRVQKNIWTRIMNESIFIQIERFLCWNPLSQGLMFILNAKFEFSYDVSAPKISQEYICKF